LGSLQFWLAGRVEFFGFGLGENSQNVNQVARGAADCLWGSASVSVLSGKGRFDGAKGDGTLSGARLAPLAIGADLYLDFVINVKK
jgi:hypothetical protein